MTRSLVLFTLALLLALPLFPASFADDDPPTIAVLRFGPLLTGSLTEDGLLGRLHGAGYLSDEEFFLARNRQDVMGESLNLHWGDADYNFANVALIIESALDKSPDLLVTFSSPMTLAAINATADLDDPPAIIFSHVYNPFESGVAQTSCVKPSHVTGLAKDTPYSDVVELLMLYDNALETIGVLYSASEPAGVYGAEEIETIASAMGLHVELAAVVGLADVTVAAEGLIAKGAEAIVSPADLITTRGLPALQTVATENEVPLFHSNFGAITLGATISAGASQNTLEGRVLGTLVEQYLNGSLDVAGTGIGVFEELTVGLNADAAESQGVAISESLLERVDITIANDTASESGFIAFLADMGADDAAAKAMIGHFVKISATGDRLEIAPEVVLMIQMLEGAPNVLAANEAFVESLHCTDEMIAEQQAALDAGGG